MYSITLGSGLNIRNNDHGVILMMNWQKKKKKSKYEKQKAKRTELKKRKKEKRKKKRDIKEYTKIRLKVWKYQNYTYIITSRVIILYIT